MHVYIEENIVYEYEKIFAEIDDSGICSVIRKNKITARLEKDPLLNKKLSLYGGRNIQSYAEKIGKKVADLNPDKEFKITARNTTSAARLDSSTRIEGLNKDILVTDVRFDKLLTCGVSFEIEIEYHNLDAGFYLTSLWEEPHICQLLIKPDTQTREMEVTIRFPKVLPDWFMRSEVGVNPIPRDWARISSFIDNGRSCVVLKANDLNVGISYRASIYARDNRVGNT